MITNLPSPLLNQKGREGKPQTVQFVRQGEADKVIFDLETELVAHDGSDHPVAGKFSDSHEQHCP